MSSFFSVCSFWSPLPSLSVPWLSGLFHPKVLDVILKLYISWFLAQHRVCCVQRSLCFCAAAELIVQVDTFSREVTKIFLFRDLLNHWLVKMAESGKLRRIIGKYEKVRSKLMSYKYNLALAVWLYSWVRDDNAMISIPFSKLKANKN